MIMGSPLELPRRSSGSVVARFTCSRLRIRDQPGQCYAGMGIAPSGHDSAHTEHRPVKEGIYEGS
jgi:hypothetical protein